MGRELPRSARTSAAAAFVASNGWLAICKPDFRDWIVANLRWHHYAAGEGITHAGDDSGAGYCVGDGQVDFLSSVGATNTSAGYFALPGMWWGYTPLMSMQRIGSVVAATDSLCGALPVSVLRTYLDEHPDGWRMVAFGVSALFVQAAGAHADLLIADSGQRVAATLLRLGGYRHHLFPSRPPENLVCTQEQLAGATALSRNTVGKRLRELERDGLLKARHGRITIVNLDRLKLQAMQSRLP